MYVGQILCFLSASVWCSTTPKAWHSSFSQIWQQKKVEKNTRTATSCGCTAYKTLPAERAGDYAGINHPTCWVGLLGMRTPRSSPARKARVSAWLQVKTLMTHPPSPAPPPLWSGSLEEGVNGSTTLPRDEGYWIGIYRAAMNWSPGTKRRKKRSFHPGYGYPVDVRNFQKKGGWFIFHPKKGAP